VERRLGDSLRKPLPEQKAQCASDDNGYGIDHCPQAKPPQPVVSFFFSLTQSLLIFLLLCTAIAQDLKTLLTHFPQLFGHKGQNSVG